MAARTMLDFAARLTPHSSGAASLSFCVEPGRSTTLGLPRWALDDVVVQNLRLISVRCAGAIADPDHVFAERARAAYALVHDQARRLDRPWPVRAWNFVPAIHAASAEGDRYMTFNAGRHRAMTDWFGEAFAVHVPAATGVGHDGDDLEVHVLLADRPGTHVENARQTPAYRYSARYGALAPCFARATRVGDWLLVAGTAAVVGEESFHPQSFEQQLDLTLAHLRHVAATGGGAAARFEQLRVYLSPDAPADQARLASRLARDLFQAEAAAERIEYVPARLCRRELLIEIEALVHT